MLEPRQVGNVVTPLGTYPETSLAAGIKQPKEGNEPGSERPAESRSGH
jgi:hypothetical protein